MLFALLLIFLFVALSGIVLAGSQQRERGPRSRPARNAPARKAAPKKGAGDGKPAAASTAKKKSDADPGKIYLPPRNEENWRPMLYSEMSAPVLEKLARGLPSLPIAAGRVAGALDDPQMNPRKVAQIVATDPSLAARLLHIVNSPFYALGKPTGDLRWAIVLLGYSQIKGIIFRSVLNETISKKAGMNESLDRLWEHSYLVSVAAPLIAKEIKVPASQNLATAGLLLDIGKIALVARYPDKAKEVYSDGITSERRVARIEEETFGLDHAVAGRMMASKWNLPEEVVRLIESHLLAYFAEVPFLPAADMKGVALLHLAEKVARWYVRATQQQELEALADEGSDEPTEWVDPDEPNPLYYNVLGIEPSFETLISPPVIAGLREGVKFLSDLPGASAPRNPVSAAGR